MRERNSPVSARVGDGPVVVVVSLVVLGRLRIRPGWSASPDGAGVMTSVPVNVIVSVKK